MSDLRAAVERKRRLLSGKETVDDIYGVAFILDDLHLIRDAYLAEHPPDDDEPVTEEWLRSVGFMGSRTLEFVYGTDFECDHKCCITWSAAFGFSLGGSSTQSPLPRRNNGTRGDVRRLCSALGVPLQPAEEQSDG